MARTRASDFEEKQHGLLVSAAAVFAEQGMEKASMAQIASHSGVSKALLYHYYPSKDVLIFAIIHTHLVDLEASVAAAVDEGLTPEEQLRVLVGVVLEKYRGADDAHKVQLVGTAARPHDLLGRRRQQLLGAGQRRAHPLLLGRRIGHGQQGHPCPGGGDERRRVAHRLLGQRRVVHVQQDVQRHQAHLTSIRAIGTPTMTHTNTAMLSRLRPISSTRRSTVRS